MNANVGSTDKVIRLVLALVAVVAAFVAGVSSALGIVLLVLGVVLAVTALTGFCPIYRVLGMSTGPARR
jgi:Inner membrane protein YgaP-like, transmembrane domain